MPHSTRKRKAQERAAVQGEAPAQVATKRPRIDKPAGAKSGDDLNEIHQGFIKAKKSKSHGKEGKDTSKTRSTQHSVAIAGFHTMLKRIARCDDPQEKAKLQAQLEEEYGGLDGYQQQSLTGRDRHNAGETGKWLVKAVGPLWKQEQEATGKRKLRLLDVGSLSGTAYSKNKWIEATNIDLNPQTDAVIKSDFFEFSLPKQPTERFDCVALSLVVNFEGDLFRRGEMLLRAHKHLTPAGYMFLVLPLACVNNSRYLDHNRLRAILRSCGWDIIQQDDSAKLTRWLCQRRQDQAPEAKWDGTVFKKEELHKGASRNNFCIRVGQSKSKAS